MIIRLKPEQEARLVQLETDGRLTVESVLADAADASSPLNALFEWDDGEAAKLYRKAQAREIIRYVEVTVNVTHRQVTVERYVPDPDKRPGYVSLTAVRNEATQRAIALNECNRALGGMRRAADIAAALGLDDGSGASIVDAWEQWRDVFVDDEPLASAAD